MEIAYVSLSISITVLLLVFVYIWRGDRERQAKWGALLERMEKGQEKLGDT